MPQYHILYYPSTDAVISQGKTVESYNMSAAISDFISDNEGIEVIAVFNQGKIRKVTQVESQVFQEQSDIIHDKMEAEPVIP